MATKSVRPGPSRGRTRPAKNQKPSAAPQTSSPRKTKTKAKRSRSKAPNSTAESGLRLQVILARAGISSRRRAEELIAAGEVTVNGKVVTVLGTRADPERDHVKVSGKLIAKFPHHQYFAYHKPVGIITTLSDPEGRPCIGDVVGSLGERVYPVGRLDFHSSGLLLLTNDGDLCARLTHPSSHVEKRYTVKVTGAPSDAMVARLREGVRLDDGRTAPAYVRVERTVGNKAWIDLHIIEGRNRQVRRMLEAVGLRVEKLRRTAVGPIKLGDLPTGSARKLSNAELVDLKRAVGTK